MQLKPWFADIRHEWLHELFKHGLSAGKDEKSTRFDYAQQKVLAHFQTSGTFTFMVVQNRVIDDQIKGLHLAFVYGFDVSSGEFVAGNDGIHPQIRPVESLFENRNAVRMVAVLFHQNLSKVYELNVRLSH